MAKENDLTIDLTGFVMPPTAVHHATASSSLMVGNNYSNGMATSGAVERMTLDLRTGIIAIHVNTTPGSKEKTMRRVYILATGMMCEEKLS